MIKNFLRLARPHHYTKNLFILIPAFFSFQIFELSLLINIALAFTAFSLIASSGYIFNDILDRHEDSKHPSKLNRPIASNLIKPNQAFIFLLFLFFVGILTGSFISINALVLLIVYFCLNLLYTLILKNIALIDVIVIACGFIIRLLVGAEAANVELSHWIIVMTFLLALFLSLAKRRDDTLIYLKTDKKMRKSIDGYNLKFLDASLIMSASITIMAFILWSISPEVSSRLNSNNIFVSAIFVILGILRYLQIIFIEEKSGDPTLILFKDKFIQITIASWLIYFFWLLY